MSPKANFKNTMPLGISLPNKLRYIYRKMILDWKKQHSKIMDSYTTLSSLRDVIKLNGNPPYETSVINSILVLQDIKGTGLS